ncbi:MAG TPA: ATP-binding protein [Planctomycetota bacterium]|jgi:signal transduction histidine kinase
MTESMRILIVDDEMGMRLGAQRALSDFVVNLPDVNGDVRFNVDVAGTGEEALKKIAESAPDLLLLDHKLPGISGLDILGKIVQEKPEILTIMITAYASLDTAITATKRGAYDFLAKPFTPTELKASVRKAVRHLIVLRQARKLALEKRQVRFQFISVVAHELKAPLAAIEGYLQIISSRTLGQDLGAYDQVIERSMVRVQGMRKMIMDLLDLTRIESGTKTREVVEVDVRKIAAAAIDTVMADAKARQITVQLNAPEPVQMIGDPGEVEIVLNNLITNAVKYNRNGGRVDCTLTVAPASLPAGEMVKIVVKDTGIGMSKEETDRLFNDFVRIKNEKTRSILGSGLGLSIVKKLAQLNGGEAVVTSQPDKGSVFTVTLQQKPPVPDTNSAPSFSSAPTVGGSTKKPGTSES